MELWILLIALGLILVGAETFTNALEHLGERLGISEGVTGSIFAAVGTALPEAMVPVVAVLASSASLETRYDVGVGAILGAPLMLSTLTLFLMGTPVVTVFRLSRHMRVMTFSRTFVCTLYERRVIWVLQDSE